MSAPAPPKIVSTPLPDFNISSPEPLVMVKLLLIELASIFTTFVGVITALASTWVIPVLEAFEESITLWALSEFSLSISLLDIFKKSLSLILLASLNSRVSVPLPPITVVSAPNSVFVNLRVSSSAPASI